MQTFTHLEFIELDQNEKTLKATLNQLEENEALFSPKKQTIDTILNYSKALSVKKSKHVEFIETILN